MAAIELNSLHSDKLVKRVIEIVAVANGGQLPEGINEDKLRQMLCEGKLISGTVQEMCGDREAAKLIINISEQGTISPEVHLKGSAAVNYLLEKKK